MKKEYITPNAEVILLNIQQTLLAGSDPSGVHDQIGSGEILAPEFNIDED